MAFDPSGEALAVWWHHNGSTELIQAASRPAGGSWQAPVTVSEGPGPGEEERPRVAFDPQGEAAVAWERYRGSARIIQAASRPAGGSWQAPVSLTEPGQDAYGPQLAFDPQGEAVAVWQRSNGSNYTIQAARRPAGGSWQAPDELSEPGQDAREAQVAFDSPGHAVAVWSTFGGRIEAASRPADDSWQAPADLSEAGQYAFQPQVALDSQGDAVAVWNSFNGADHVVQAASRPAAGSWEAPVNVSETGPIAGAPKVAFDSQGDAVAVWVGGAEVIQAASHDAAGPLLEDLSLPTGTTTWQPVVFSVSPLDEWSALGRTSWRFSDGGTASGTNVTHTYTAAGRYEVTVESEDALGQTTSASGPITVSAPITAPMSPPVVTGSVSAGARAGASAAVNRGVAAIRLTCTGDHACKGTVKLVAPRKNVLIGSAGFSIAEGSSETVHIRLNRKGVALVRNAGRRGLKVSVKGSGLETAPLLLRATVQKPQRQRSH